MRTIAFFSFKGGVGRTALLLNLATWWAGRGRVVAVMDLDLTAPGLSYSPLAGDHLYPEGAGFGMADLLDAYQQGKPGTSDELNFLPPHLLLRDLGPPRDDGRLFLIGAGAQPYVETQARDHGPVPPLPRRPLPDTATPEEQAFAALAEAVREDLGAWIIPAGICRGRPIDYLLIDTRTGFAELVGLGLGLLADKRVLVSGLNEQNLHGLRLTLEAVLPTIQLDTLPIALTLVLSPLPAAEDEALLRRLEDAHRLVADTLRYTSAGRREQAPPSFPIHYTPLLALGDAPLVDRFPKSLYAREIQAIAGHLEEALGLDADPDELMARARREAGRILEPPRPLPPLERSDVERPHPLADLPAWRWPLDAVGRGEEAGKRLDELVRTGEGVLVDREALLDLLAWSDPFFREKRDTLDELPKLSQGRLNALITLMEEERPRLMSRWGDESARRQLADKSIETMANWARLVLNDSDGGAVRALTTLLRDPDLLPQWQVWPEYWQALAQWLLPRTDQLPMALEAVDRALIAGGEPARVAEDLLAGLRPNGLPESVLEILERKARTLAPGDPWLNYLQARIRLQRTPADREGAKALLAPLLADPPTDGGRCYDLTVMVRKQVPEISSAAEGAARRAVQLLPTDHRAWHELGILLLDHLAGYEEAETAFRKTIEFEPKNAIYHYSLGLSLVKMGRHDEAAVAYRKTIELNPKAAHFWDVLGNLLTEYLARYEEAEVAYRKAIEIDPEFAPHWSRLGTLLAEYLARFNEAEAAYRKSIELDPKLAIAWNNLACLRQNHLARYEEAEAAYRKAIELDPKFASAWNNLGYLLLHVGGDCPGAADAFERGVAGKDERTADYSRIHLAHTRLRQGQPAAVRPLLREALSGFLARQRFEPRALHLALELDDAPEADRQAERARQEWGRTRDVWAANTLLCYACCDPVSEAREAAWQRLLGVIGTHYERYVTLDHLHLLAGLCPDARDAARAFARRLLDPSPALIERCKGQPAPPAMWERFRPFVEGRSAGAGDPADGFCAGGQGRAP